MSSSRRSTWRGDAARVAVLCVALAACAPVPGAGWQADGPPPAPDPSVPVPPPCVGPLDGPLLEVVDLPTDAGTQVLTAAPDRASTEQRAITLVHLGADTGADTGLDTGADGTEPSTAGQLTLGASTSERSTCSARVVFGPADDAALRSLAAAWAALDSVPLQLGAVSERVATLAVTELAHVGPRPAGAQPAGATWRDLNGDATRDATGDATGDAGSGGVLAAALHLAAELERRAGSGSSIELIVLRAEDVAAQLDVVAHVADGVVPVVLPSPPTGDADDEARADDAADDAADSEDAAAALLAALLEGVEVAADGTRFGVRWAASSLEHERALVALLDAALLDAAAPSDAALPERPERWVTPLPDTDARDSSKDDGGARELWLGDVRDPVDALQAAVAAAMRGAAFVAVDGADLRSGALRTARMRALVAEAPEQEAEQAPDQAAEQQTTTTVVHVGALHADSVWQLETVLLGTPLPEGGFLPLEDRRIVALYGSPGTSALGILGAQDAPATIVRAREVANRYQGMPDGREPIAGLDVIATIASRGAGPTGDYSRRVPISELRPLVDLAREAGVAVILDLQPGRTSFLVQAEEYVELLREPHVHLALDPEWRIGPREVHLVRIGSVAAEEVQAVTDWLAALVRSERLPQKMLILHQFTLGMLPDRDTIVMPPELVGVIHVDGQGSQGAKNQTYARLSGGASEQWEWGWKNFTRIDVPVATPELSVARIPIPVVITYQ